MFDQALIDQLVQRELQKSRPAEEYRIRPEEQDSPQQVKPLDPKLAMMLGGALDAGSTFTFLKRKTAKEGNPMFKYFNGNPWATLPTAAAVGTGYHFLHKLLKNKAPKIADTAAGLIGGFQMGLGGRNLQNTTSGRNSDRGSMYTVTKDLMLKGK